MNDDLTLLREYARGNSEEAFAALVSRHVNLVYSVALRQVRDPHLADEITQAVFIILARKAGSRGPKTILSGWLCRAARYASANALTIQRRRQCREQEAFMQSTLEENPSNNVWQELSPLLDEAMSHLGATDRKEFEKVAMENVGERKGVFRQLSAGDHRYFSFQLWKEGIARYTQIKAAEASARYRPTPEYAALPDYESFAAYAARARAETLKELRQADLAKMRRVFVYSFGAAEGLLLDRMNPGWKNEYFHRPLSTDYWFEGKKK